MKTYKTRKRFNIIAGMPFAPSSTGNAMRIVGYKIIEFVYDSPQKDLLISEKEIERVFTY